MPEHSYDINQLIIAEGTIPRTRRLSYPENQTHINITARIGIEHYNALNNFAKQYTGQNLSAAMRLCIIGYMRYVQSQEE